MIRTVARSVARRAVGSRLYSTSLQSSKICVVPFKQSPMEARDRLYVEGLLASASWGNVIYSGALRVFGNAIELFGKEFGFGESLQLKDLKAAYYPLWRVDVSATGRVSPMRGGEESPAYLIAREAYVPGNPFAPLSYISYAVPPLERELKIYEPSRDLNQLDGHEIVPVPFTVDPIEFVDKIRRQVGRRCALEGTGLKVDESKWEGKLLAAYPVMFPIYIAEFEHKEQDGKRSFTMIMDAHEENSHNCRVSFPPPQAMREAGRMNRNYYVNPAPFAPHVELMVSAARQGELSAPSPSKIVKEAYAHWMSPKPQEMAIAASPTLSTSQRTKGEINWSDPRIQTWSGEERDQNGIFLEQASNTYRMIEALEAMAAFADSHPDNVKLTLHEVKQGPDGERVEEKSADEMRSDVDKNITKMLSELEESKPQWLRRYDEEKAQAAAQEKKAVADKDTK